MAGENKHGIDYKTLSKKYRTDIKKIISLWKRNYSDMEIAKNLGIDMLTLQQLKTDIELAHRRKRVELKKKRHLFLGPYN